MRFRVRIFPICLAERFENLLAVSFTRSPSLLRLILIYGFLAVNRSATQDAPYHRIRWTDNQAGMGLRSSRLCTLVNENGTSRIQQTHYPPLLL
jgi:hypothetical protein